MIRLVIRRAWEEKKKKRLAAKIDSYISDETDITYCDKTSVTIQRNGALSIKTAIIDIWKSNPEGSGHRYKMSPYTSTNYCQLLHDPDKPTKMNF